MGAAIMRVGNTTQRALAQRHPQSAQTTCRAPAWNHAQFWRGSGGEMAKTARKKSGFRQFRERETGLEPATTYLEGGL